jgi:hypothetical protein
LPYSRLIRLILGCWTGGGGLIAAGAGVAEDSRALIMAAD